MWPWLLPALAAAPLYPLPDGGAAAATHEKAGRAALAKDDTLTAFQAFDDCLALDARNEACRLALATTLIDTGYDIEAIPYLETLLALSPGHAEATARWSSLMKTKEAAGYGRRDEGCGPEPKGDALVGSVRQALAARDGRAVARTLDLKGLSCTPAVPSWRTCWVAACQAPVVGQAQRHEVHTFEIRAEGATLSHDPRAQIDAPRPLRVGVTPGEGLQAVPLPPDIDEVWIRVVPAHGQEVDVVATGATFRPSGWTGRVWVTGGDREIIPFEVDHGAPAGLLVRASDQEGPLDPLLTAGIPSPTTPLSERTHRVYSRMTHREDLFTPLTTAEATGLIARAAEPFFAYATKSLSRACGGATFAKDERLLLLGPRGANFDMLRSDGSMVSCELEAPPYGSCPGPYPHLRVRVGTELTGAHWSSEDTRACAE